MTFDLFQQARDWYRGWVDAHACIYEDFFGLGGPITQEYLDTHPDYKSGFEAGRRALEQADEAMKKRERGGKQP